MAGATFSKAGVAVLGAFADAASRAVTRYLCNNIDAIGAKYLGDNNILATYSVAAFKYLACDPGLPPDGSLTPEVPFPGGQCEGAPYYLISTYKIDGQPRVTSPGQGGAETAYGPIKSVTYYVGPGNVWRRVLLSGNPTVQSDVSIGVPYPLYSDWVFSHPQIYDGYVDNCGDLSTPANPGLIFPGPVPQPGTTIAFEVDESDEIERPGLPPIPFTLPVGPLVVAPSGELNVDVGGQKFRLNPDFELDLQEASTQDVLDAVQELSDAIEELQDSADTELSGTVALTSCAGEEISAFWGGFGIRGLSAQLDTFFAVLDTYNQGECALPPSSEGLESIPIGSVESGDIPQFYDFELPANTRFVAMMATTSVRPIATAGSVGANQEGKQSKFGIFSFLVETGNDYAVIATYRQFYNLAWYAPPEWVQGSPGLACRVSIQPGSAASLTAFYSPEEG